MGLQDLEFIENVMQCVVAIIHFNHLDLRSLLRFPLLVAILSFFLEDLIELLIWL